MLDGSCCLVVCFVGRLLGGLLLLTFLYCLVYCVLVVDCLGLMGCLGVCIVKVVLLWLPAFVVFWVVSVVFGVYCFLFDWFALVMVVRVVFVGLLDVLLLPGYLEFLFVVGGFGAGFGFFGLIDMMVAACRFGYLLLLVIWMLVYLLYSYSFGVVCGVLGFVFALDCCLLLGYLVVSFLFCLSTGVCLLLFLLVW